MTVPGRGRADRASWRRRCRPVPARRRHRDRRRHGARGDRRRARRSSSARSSGRDVDRRLPRARRRRRCPGCFSPTEILDGARARRRHRQGVSGDGARPAVHQGRPRAAAAGEADADRRRHARQRRRLDPRRRGRGRRRARRCSTPRRSRSGRLEVITANARRIVASVAAARSTAMSARVVTFGEIMLRLSPPGFERLFQSPMLSATFGGGEANVAVSLAHFGLDSHYVTRLPSHAIGDAAIRALRAEGVRTEARRPRRQPRRHLLRRNGRQPARVDGHLRPRALGDQRDRRRRGGLGSRHERRGVVSRHRHHAGARRKSRRGDASRCRGGQACRRPRQRRPQLSQEALDRGAGTGDDAAADARGRCRHRQRGRPAVGPRRATSRAPTSSAARSTSPGIGRRPRA